jgi:hypothetical protein
LIRLDRSHRVLCLSGHRMRSLVPIPCRSALTQLPAKLLDARPFFMNCVAQHWATLTNIAEALIVRGRYRRA